MLNNKVKIIINVDPLKRFSTESLLHDKRNGQSNSLNSIWNFNPKNLQKE